MIINPNGLREAVRSATVTYPVPFLVGTLLVFAVTCFLIAAAAHGVVILLTGGCGAICALSALAIIGYAMVSKPELLRSETHVLMTRYFEVLGDRSLDEATRSRVSQTILSMAQEREPTSRPDPEGFGPTRAGEEQDDA